MFAESNIHSDVDGRSATCNKYTIHIHTNLQQLLHVNTKYWTAKRPVWAHLLVATDIGVSAFQCKHTRLDSPQVIPLITSLDTRLWRTSVDVAIWCRSIRSTICSCRLVEMLQYAAQHAAPYVASFKVSKRGPIILVCQNHWQAAKFEKEVRFGTPSICHACIDLTKHTDILEFSIRDVLQSRRRYCSGW